MLSHAIRTVYHALPPTPRFFLRRLVYLPIDLYETITRKRPALVPPRGLIFTGSGDFEQQGRDWLKTFVEEAGLEPHHQVLDVGCGIGRIAAPLTSYLREPGGYRGFDIVETGVKWCRKRISRRFPNFEFRFFSLRNDLYRRRGGNPAEFRFPYADDEFDFVSLISVFTHMLPKDVDHYVAEIARVLRPGGKCLATFFVLDDESKRTMVNELFDFPHDHGEYRTLEPGVQSADIAYEESYIRESLATRHGLTVEKLFHGDWSGRPLETCRDFQDIVILGH